MKLKWMGRDGSKKEQACNLSDERHQGVQSPFEGPRRI